MKTNKSYKIFKIILTPIFKLWYRPKIVNSEVIPKDGPVIFAGNHRHIMDQCPVIISTKRQINWMAKKEYFDGPFRWFFKMTGCIPVNRQIHDDSAKSKALDILKKGGAIGIFPEGTRNRTNKPLLPFKFGAVSMAKKTNATIIPFAITGDYKLTNNNLTITFGKPFKVNKSLEEANKKLEQEILKLYNQVQ